MKTNLLLFSISCIFCFVLGESTLRFLLSEQSMRDRFLMWTSPHFMLHENKAVTYLPNENVREVAVYFGQIEYDVDYQTNNLGYVDHIAYKPEERINTNLRRIVIVGDSFAIGTGAEPWSPKLRDKLRSQGKQIQLYNLGLTGASVTHFYKSLIHFSKSFPIEEVVVVGISNDFERLDWWPLIDGADIRLCPIGESEKTCLHRLPFAKVVDINASSESLLLETNKIRASYEKSLEKKKTELSLPLRYSRLLLLAYNFLTNRPLFALGEQNQKVNPQLLSFLQQKNLKAIENMRKDFPRAKISFLHLPEKEEVVLGRYALELDKEIENLGVEYLPALNKCLWTREMFHQNDAHPNQLGYQNVAKCFSKLVLNERY